MTQTAFACWALRPLHALNSHECGTSSATLNNCDTALRTLGLDKGMYTISTTRGRDYFGWQECFEKDAYLYGGVLVWAFTIGELDQELIPLVFCYDDGPTRQYSCVVYHDGEIRYSPGRCGKGVRCRRRDGDCRDIE